VAALDGNESHHEARFEKWQRLAPSSARLVGTLVASQLVPRLEAQGFQRSHSLRQVDQIVSGRTIELERWGGDCVDTVTFNFDKCGDPRFQVQLARRSSKPPHAWVRSANLVRRPGQYLHFWGKPWWCPGSLWSEGASRRVVARVESLLPTALPSWTKARVAGTSAGGWGEPQGAAQTIVRARMVEGNHKPMPFDGGPPPGGLVTLRCELAHGYGLHDRHFAENEPSGRPPLPRAYC
jgi:hypothetical protein